MGSQSKKYAVGRTDGKSLPSGRWKKRWFSSAAEASAFISTLPGHENGIYYIDAPAVGSKITTLRQQIEDIANRKVNPILATTCPFHRMLEHLCVAAFRQQWPENCDTRAMRKALELLHHPGWISNEEPAVK